MDTAQDQSVPTAAALTVGAPAGDLTPADIDALAIAGDYAGISKPYLSPILGRYYERNWSQERATPSMTPRAGAFWILRAASPPRLLVTTIRP